MIRFLESSIATLYVGRLPKAPGTWGSLAAVLVWWVIMPLGMVTQITLITAAFLIGWWATHGYEKNSKKHDPKEVVADELIGMWICLLGAPKQWVVYTIGFLLFRIFDIAKPFPIGWIDRKVPGALGTILDDVVAGVFAFLILNLVLIQGRQFGLIH